MWNLVWSEPQRNIKITKIMWAQRTATFFFSWKRPFYVLWSNVPSVNFRGSKSADSDNEKAWAWELLLEFRDSITPDKQGNIMWNLMWSEPQRDIKITKVMWAGHKECLKEKKQSWTKEDVVLFLLFLGILSVVGIVLVPLYCCHNSNCTKIVSVKFACINSQSFFSLMPRQLFTYFKEQIWLRTWLTKDLGWSKNIISCQNCMQAGNIAGGSFHIAIFDPIVTADQSYSSPIGGGGGAMAINWISISLTKFALHRITSVKQKLTLSKS